MQKTLPLIALLLITAALHAQPASPPQIDQKTIEEYARLQQQLVTLFAAKDFEKATELCRKQIELIPQSSEAHYNLACCFARQGQKEDALKELTQAVDLGFTDAAHMREDEDLTSLHDDAKFKALLTKARDKQLSAPHEKGADIPGIKTIEAFPEQGLRYRLRIDPNASAEKPARLLIWLHPSGGSMDNIIEAMSPQFAKDGYALLVFTQKDYRFWSGADAEAMMTKTLPDIAKLKEVDTKKPVLMGFSAGGQLALQLWEQHPGDFGGLVLDAAYPLDVQAYAKGQVAPLKLPKSDAIKSCPIFTIVGGADGGSNLWKAVEKSWRDAKIPLTVHIIPGKGHAWLVDKNEAPALHNWLKDVANKKLPSDSDEPSARPKKPLPDPGNQPIKV